MRHPFSTRALGFSAILLAGCLIGAGPLHAAARVSVSANDQAFEATAKSVARGGKLTVDGLLLEGDAATSTLDLERFEVWLPNAVVMVDGTRVPAPKTVYFRGSVAGYPGSSALVSVRERGGTMGMVFRADGAWAVGKGKGQGVLRSQKARLEQLNKPFECALGELKKGAGPLGIENAAATLAASPVLDSPYVANIAVETDYEYYAKFLAKPDPQQAALDYMGDLFGYADLVYSREIDTDMTIGFARLWTTNSDPYPTTSSSSTALNNFINYWNTNMQSVPRTVAHMLSGMNTGGGVAYVGVLCNYYSSPGGNLSYGYSGQLGANFSWDGDPTHNPATVVWDVMVVQHEIGHNFNSPHSHDYCGIGGSSQPIDQCWSSSSCGTPQTGLPSCSSPTPFFNGGPGTIMSYCHQVGGYNAIAMTFGEGHTCGTLPGREADRMSAHVVQRAGQYSSCFQPSTCGNGLLDAGEECDGSNFGGATCGSQGFFGGTLSCNSNCTLNTSQCTNCGNNIINAGEVCDGSALGGNTCTTLGCSGGVLQCDSTCSAFVKTACTGCPQCNDNGICEAGENCSGCPSDCAGGSSSGAVCGNHVCEAGNGENCVTCPADCNGVQTGKPSGRYCCGNGGGSNPVPCSDSLCTGGGNSCTTTPTSGGSYCCGDSTCDAAESCATCALDCSFGFEICDNGIDDDCNGLADCADGGCANLPVCQNSCAGSNAPCTVNSECCSGNCRQNGKKANTCS